MCLRSGAPARLHDNCAPANARTTEGINPKELACHWVGIVAAMGEVLDDDERAVFEALTGRPRGPAERVDELWAVIGRRGGKTRAVAVLARLYRGVV